MYNLNCTISFSKQAIFLLYYLTFRFSIYNNNKQ